MKALKKLPSFLLAMLMCISMFSMTVWAVSISQDGLEITLTTDKEDYTKDEQITATLMVKNTNDFTVTNVSLEQLVPNGYKLPDGSSATKHAESLGAGETIILNVTYTSAIVSTDGNNEEDNNSANDDGETSGNTTNDDDAINNGTESNGSTNNSNELDNVPKTGDENNIVVPLVLFILSIASIVFIVRKTKKGKQFLSLFLCFALLGTLVYPNVTQAASEQYKTCGIETVVKVNDIDVRISAKVTYSIVDSSGEQDNVTITFDLNYEDAETYKTITILSGEKISQPEAPTRNGYTFDGWYTEATGGQKFNFNTVIAGNITLYAHWIPSDEPTPTPSTYTVTFDSNGGSSVASQTIASGEIAIEPDAPIREGYTFIGWYAENTPENLNDFFTFSSTKINQNITLYAVWYHTVDTDGDQIIDGIEQHLGTDIEKKDTDNDGVSDYLEAVVLEWNPLSLDTDNDGISDGDEDPDEDGLINREENDYGTNPLLLDTDGDGLNDLEEIKVYRTNPLKIDTDNDNVSDSKEIELGTDPLTFENSFIVNSVLDGVVDDTVNPSVKIELSGEQVETLDIKRREDQLLFSEDIPGYMGGAYDFSVNGSFSQAVISFSFDDSLLSETSLPTIYYFNEGTQELEALNTTVSGNIASATVTHFSTYILIDSTIYEESFLRFWRDVWDSDASYSGVQIALVIDDSGSMDQNDEYNQRLTVAQNLVDKLPENSEIGIIKFNSRTNILTSELIKDKALAKMYLTTDYFSSSGGTRMYTAINSAFSFFNNSQKDILKMIVVLSDGETDDINQHSFVISTAQENSVRIYTVGLGNNTSYFADYLQPLSQETNASFYLAENADKLAEIYENISEKIDIETDSDGDGLADYYENNAIIFNGKKLALDKNNPDTDGDGKLDGEEIVLKYNYNEDKTKVIVIGRIVSDPTDNPNYETVAHDIAKDNIKDDKRLTMVEWKPLEGLSKTMLEQDDSLEAIVDNVPVALDAVNFVLSWLNNAKEVTQLRVITGKDKTMAIKYGSSIELDLSGKKMNLSDLLVKRFYNYSPSIIFTSGKKADEYIRNWFGLNGDGKYSMELNFGRVYIGDYGYYLLIENGEVYQVPIIHPDTTMKIYYTKNKKTQYVFDAAKILRNTRLKLSDAEKEKVLKQLRDNGFNL